MEKENEPKKIKDTSNLSSTFNFDEKGKKEDFEKKVNEIFKKVNHYGN